MPTWPREIVRPIGVGEAVADAVAAGGSAFAVAIFPEPASFSRRMSREWIAAILVLGRNLGLIQLFPEHVTLRRWK